MDYEAIPDKYVIDQWRVEGIDDDPEGLCYVTIFSGPNARQRAEDYAAWLNSTIS